MNSNSATWDVIRLGSDTTWRELDADRRSFQRAFVELLLGSPQFKGRVLDIGCGGDLPAALNSITGRYGSLDGVDPSPEVAQHPLLDQRWHAPFETSSVPSATYDCAYAYNVLEHITDPVPFFRKVHEVLKPGGVFWALTPNGRHPFALLSRSIERIGLKPFARRKIGRDEATGTMAVNDYPAYYRCNRPGAVTRAIRDLGFARARFFYFPCVQWDTYFPRWLKWAPHAFDFCIGTHLTPFMQLFIIRLEKPVQPTP